MITVNGDTMRAVAPRFSGANAQRQAAIIAAVGPALQPTLEGYAIDTLLRVAHFLAQTCHETAGFRTTEEFASGDAYEGRKDLGNTRPGDGRRFKGRGLIQLTGRANYRRVGAALGVDLEAHPERAAEPVLSLRIACEYWKGRDINEAADRDDLREVTRRINGGANGLEDRRALTAKAKAALGGGDSGEARPVLRRGAKGEAVERLQSLLRGQGSDVAADGDFGPATEAAVKRFQAGRKLAADGVVGPRTWAALEGAGAKGRPVLRRGAKGGDVERLQSLLRGLAVDGGFGPATEAAVKRFQKAHGLEVDGVVGPRTWAALEGAAGKAAAE